MAEEQYRLRGWLTEGATDDRRLSMLLRTVEVPARSQGQVLFGGDEPRMTGALPLREYREEQAVALMLETGAIDLVHVAVMDLAERNFVLAQPDGLWTLAGLRRSDLGLEPGTPGDFDLLFGAGISLPFSC